MFKEEEHIREYLYLYILKNSATLQGDIIQRYKVEDSIHILCHLLPLCIKEKETTQRFMFANFLMVI